MAELGDTKLPAAKIRRTGSLLLVIYDEEATGTDPDQAKIFQIAARSSRPESTSFKAYVNPGVEIPEDTVNYCGLDPATVELIGSNNTKGWAEVAPAFYNWIKQEKVSGDYDEVCLVSYNGWKYDDKILRTHDALYGINPSSSEIVDYTMDLYKLVTDGSIEWGIRGKPESFKLGKLYQHFENKKLDGWHEAEADVNALVTIKEKLGDQFEKLKSKYTAKWEGEKSMDENEKHLKKHVEMLRLGRHPIYSDKKECKALLESIPGERRIRGNDRRMSSPMARNMGCHEVANSNTNKSTQYPRTIREGKSIMYHQAACASTSGDREIRLSLNVMDQLTASHICGNDHCINPKHIEWETLRNNMKRIGCFGFIYVESDRQKFECDSCSKKKHGGSRCLTIRTVLSVPSFENLHI